MKFDDKQDFDSELRSIFEDAEIRPPRRVWKSISSRIRVADDPVPVFSWRRGWGWGLACAAAVALVALVVTDTFKSTDVTAPLAQVQPALDNAQSASEILQSSTAIAQSSTAIVQSSSAIAQSAPVIVQSSQGNDNSDTSSDSDILPETAVEDIEGDDSSRGISGSVIRRHVSPEETIPLVWEENTSVKNSIFGKNVQLYAQGSIQSLTVDSDFSFSGGTAIFEDQIPGLEKTGEYVHSFPVTFGLGVRFYLMPNMSVGTGLDYSHLRTVYDGKYNNDAGSVTHDIDYLGIPLNLSYDFVSTRRFKVYGYAVGEVEYAVSNRYNVAAKSNHIIKSPVSGVQWSAGVGAGVEYLFTDWLGLYADPGLRYYFPCGQPASIRTTNQLNININIGLRFGF